MTATCHVFFFQDQQSLITELRKELKLTNEEHRELLGRVHTEDKIQRIRSNKSDLYLLIVTSLINEFFI